MSDNCYGCAYYGAVKEAGYEWVANKKELKKEEIK